MRIDYSKKISERMSMKTDIKDGEMFVKDIPPLLLTLYRDNFGICLAIICYEILSYFLQNSNG